MDIFQTSIEIMKNMYTLHCKLSQYIRNTTRSTLNSSFLQNSFTLSNGRGLVYQPIGALLSRRMQFDLHTGCISKEDEQEFALTGTVLVALSIAMTVQSKLLQRAPTATELSKILQ